MLKNLRKNSTIALALLAGISLSNQQLHAQQWNRYNHAEIATAALRGLCSSIKHGLQNNSTTSAYFKRTLISALRIGHGILIVKNHPHDYHNHIFGNQYFASAYLDGSLPSDTIEGIGNIFGLIESLTQGGGRDYSGQRGLLSTPLDFMQRILLPGIESSAALYVAMSDDQIAQNQTKRFIARKILALSSLCHDFLNQDTGSAKYTTGVIILVHLIHAGYQLTNVDSDFNTWLRRRMALA